MIAVKVTFANNFFLVMAQSIRKDCLTKMIASDNSLLGVVEAKSHGLWSNLPPLGTSFGTIDNGSSY